VLTWVKPIVPSRKGGGERVRPPAGWALRQRSPIWCAPPNPAPPRCTVVPPTADDRIRSDHAPKGLTVFKENALSDRKQDHDSDTPHDPIEDVVHSIPYVLPLAGAVLMFLLAFIAISMA